MNTWIRTRLLQLLRVPPEPHPPAGAPGSVRIFRAGKNYYRLCIARWWWKEFWVLIGLIFSITFLTFVRHEAARIHQELERERALAAAAGPTAPTKPTPAPAPASTAPTPPPAKSDAAPAPAPPAKPPAKFGREEARKVIREIKPLREAENFIVKSPPWVVVVISLLEIGGVLFFLVQLPFSYAAVRLNYEQHWYIVTDRSLRIRTGLNVMLESTMSFANIQQVVVAQGPLQRLLGLADVRVQSAGGGSSGEGRPGQSQAESLHVGVFHSVDNADEIRDLVLARLKQFREAGLGDPEDARAAAGSPATTQAPSPVSTGTTTRPVGADTHAAAQELLQEARALRQAMSS